MKEAVREKLLELQGDRTDAQMGELLGIGTSHWRHIKARRRGVSYRILQRAIKVFPSLYPIVMRDLIGDGVPASEAVS